MRQSYICTKEEEDAEKGRKTLLAEKRKKWRRNRDLFLPETKAKNTSKRTWSLYPTGYYENAKGYSADTPIERSVFSSNVFDTASLHL